MRQALTISQVTASGRAHGHRGWRDRHGNGKAQVAPEQRSSGTPLLLTNESLRGGGGMESDKGIYMSSLINIHIQQK